MDDISTLNNKLKKIYGVHEDGRPYFRLSWTSTQSEKRFGTFREFYGKIFLREYDGVAEKLKYPWCKDRWVLEKLTFPMRMYKYWSPELIGVENGSYEPVWVFSKNEQYQKPEWNPITKLVSLALYGPTEKSTPSQIDAEYLLDEQKQEDELFNIIDNNSPYIPGMLHSGSAIIVP